MNQIFIKKIHAKDPFELKYLLIINKTESKSLKYLSDSGIFIEYSNIMDDIYKYIKNYDSNKKRKILLVFDDMIADMLSNKKLNPIVTELFVRRRTLNSFSCFYHTILFGWSKRY